jgi:hypothetical protein
MDFDDDRFGLFKHYILDERGEPKVVDFETWARWFEASRTNRSRIIAQDKDESGETTVMVSTVFLGLDHNYGGKGPPILWETLVFGGVLDGEMERYSSREAALRGHQELCAKVAATVPKPNTSEGS